MKTVTLKINQSKAALATLPAAVQIVLASCIIGICAQIKIPLYFTPVPLTITTCVIMLAGALLGSRKGALAVLCYLAQGWMGLPVFAGGASGLLHFMGPTGGYLIGYVVQAFVVGWLLEKKHDKSIVTISGILLASTCLEMGIGSLWLAQFVGIESCLKLGFFPFFFIEVVKALAIATLIKFFNKSN